MPLAVPHSLTHIRRSSSSDRPTWNLTLIVNLPARRLTVDRLRGGVSGRLLQPASVAVDAGRPFTTQLTLFNYFPACEKISPAANRLLALLNNAGTRHRPINKFRLHRASQRWLYWNKITVIMKRLIEWLTLTCPLHEYWVTLPQRNVNCFGAPLHCAAAVRA